MGPIRNPDSKTNVKFFWISNNWPKLILKTPNNTWYLQELMDATSFWLEKVCLPTIGICGIIGNLIAICVYQTGANKFNTIFYKLLNCLLTLHIFYIGFNLVNIFGLHSEQKTFEYVYSYALYPMPSMLLHASTFMTVLLAWHRFKAADVVSKDMYWDGTR